MLWELQTYCSTRLDMQILPTPTMLRTQSAQRSHHRSRYPLTGLYPRARGATLGIRNASTELLRVQWRTGHKQDWQKYQLSSLFMRRDFGHPVRTAPTAMRIGALTRGTSGIMPSWDHWISQRYLSSTPTTHADEQAAYRTRKIVYAVLERAHPLVVLVKDGGVVDESVIG